MENRRFAVQHRATATAPSAEPPLQRPVFGTKKPSEMPSARGDISGSPAWDGSDQCILTGHDMSPRPAWALILRSPYEPWGGATSWIGGRPCVPVAFEWPRDIDGSPLTFLAQIDLSALLPEQSTGQYPPALPRDGAMLVFVGETYSCQLVSAAAMADAKPADLPSDLPSARKHGFFCDRQTLNFWPVSPVAFFDNGKDPRPADFPDRFARVEDWIVNWGIAALEAELATASLQRELEWSRHHYDRLVQRPSGAADHQTNPAEDEHHRQIATDGPGLLAALEEWHARCQAQPPEAPVDRALLTAIFETRRAFFARMVSSYRPNHVLLGSWRMLSEKLMRGHGRIDDQRFYEALPSAYKPFIEAFITDWRMHRLFGVEPEFANNDEDLAGHDCLISIFADSLLAIESEHEYGLSIWCPHQDLQQGRYDRGQLVRHCAV